MIFTSNFKIAGHLPQTVAISRGLPRGWRGRVYRPLAPSWALVKITDPQQFIRLYRTQVLDKLNAGQVLQDLGGDDVVLLCWEPPGEFCHRQVVAAWLLKEVGARVEEFNPNLKRHAAWLREIQGRR